MSALFISSMAVMGARIATAAFFTQDAHRRPVFTAQLTRHTDLDESLCRSFRRTGKIHLKSRVPGGLPEHQLIENRKLLIICGPGAGGSAVMQNNIAVAVL